jgi:hypothetical protein
MGAAPPPYDSTSPFYLPEASLNRPNPGRMTRVILWRGTF